MIRVSIVLSMFLSAISYADTPAPTSPAKPLEPGKPFTETIPGSTVTIDMVPIPAGEIKLPKDAAPAKIPAMYMSKTEVIWDAYGIFCYQLDMSEKDKAAGLDAKSRPSRPYGDPTHGFGNHNMPAIHITRFAAEQFCVWLSKKTGHKYRLPTEAEWTYACRAGGDGKVADLDKVAWFLDNADDKTHPVGKKEPNAWGLCDMLGNAAEYIVGYEGKPIACGGSYDDKGEDCTSLARKTQNPDWNSTDPQNPKSKWWLSDGPFVSFRIVCDQ